MCGLIGGRVPLAVIEAALPAIAHRGPDGSGTYTSPGPDSWNLGHTRLAIQGIDAPTSAQPYTDPSNRVTLTYNGELWDSANALTGDTPEVAHALATAAPADALRSLHGMFALAWVTENGDAYLARDTYGEVPLHYGRTSTGALVWASELRALLALGATPASIQWFPPGYLLRAPADPTQREQLARWTAPPAYSPPGDFSAAVTQLRCLLDAAVASRMTADPGAPVAVLLSGGLDSAAVVASLIAQGYRPHPYIAVHSPRAADLRFARALAERWELDLCEVAVPAPTPARLAEAVRAAEMPHKAQVEITLACLELARVLHSDGFKVVLSGEGSDELWASYGMSYHGIAKKGWHAYRRELFTDQHRKNFPRTNKVFMAAGVEARMPFLDPPLADYALTLSQAIVRGEPASGALRPHVKAVLAAAASGLPPEVAYRSKRAFQTEAKLDMAAAAAVANPQAYYRAEFTRAFRGVRP